MISSGPSSVCKTSKKVQDTLSRTPPPIPKPSNPFKPFNAHLQQVSDLTNIVFMEQSHIRFVRPMRQQYEKKLRQWISSELKNLIFIGIFMLRILGKWMDDCDDFSFRCNQRWPTTPSSRRITATPPCHTPPTGPPCPTRANRNTTPFTRLGRAPLRAPTPPPEGPPQDRRWCPTTPTMRGEWCPPKGTRQAMDHHSSLDTTTGKSHPILESPTFPGFPPGKIILSKIDENNSTTIVHHLK